MKRRTLPPIASSTLEKKSRSASFQARDARSFAGKHFVEMRPAHRHSPAIHRLLEADGNSALHLVVDLLVHTGHGNKDGGMKLAQDPGHVLDKRTIGNGDATIEFSKIDMARGDVGERKKADGKIELGWKSNSSSETERFDAILPCVSMAPLGTPVVPLV